MTADAQDPLEGVDPRIAYFDGFAESWDVSGPDPAAGIRRMEALRGAIGLEAGCDVLEVGCGTGSLTAWLVEAARPGRVTGIDFAPRMIAKAAVRRLDASFRCLDVCADDLGAGRYDVALCFHSFPHFRDQAAALRNLARSLKAAGRLAVVHLRGSEQINAFHASVGGAVRGDRLPQGEQWDGLLAEAGLTRQELRDAEDGFLLVARRPAASADASASTTAS
jgi:SAM-dependent methyltransferase